MTPRSLTFLSALALLAAACATYSVEGDFAGRTLDGHADPERTIVLIHNHGFSLARAGTYRPVTPPILRLAGDRNPDVVVFSQVRNLANPTAADHAAFIASAVAYFHAERGVAPGRPRGAPADPRALRRLWPGQPRRVLGPAVRGGVLRRPRPAADRRRPRADPRAPGPG